MGPIVITAATTAVAIAPAIFFGDIAGQEIVRPMAVVILGGLVTSTLANLFILPGLYVGFGARHEPEPLGLDAAPGRRGPRARGHRALVEREEGLA